MATVSVADLEALCRAAFAAHGFGAEAADVCTREVVEAECRGRRSHGVAMVPRLLAAAKPDAGTPTRTLDSPTLAHIDGNGAPGPLVSEIAMDLAIAKAEAGSGAAVGVRNDAVFLTAGYQPRRATERGLVALVVGVAAPKLAPWGSAAALIGTDPLGLAVPAEPEPLVLDMAIGALKPPDVRIAEQRGESLPDGVAIAADGTPTTDPAAALEGALLPFGGHRGSGLGIMIELLAGALVGAHTGPLPGPARGALFVALRPDSFGFGAEFADAVREFAEWVRDSPPRAGAERVLMPGDRAAASAAAARRDGLELAENALEKLRAAGAGPP
jgi:LDH2 family malate/lactate/ureidoglycolate dehydrogenase